MKMIFWIVWLAALVWALHGIGKDIRNAVEMEEEEDDDRESQE